VRDRRPLYVQVAERIKAEFAAESMTDEVRLPSEASLAERYQVSRTTVREAYRLLEQEGAILARHGVGTFVSYKPDRPSYTFDMLSPATNVMRMGSLGDSVLIGRTLLPLSRVLRGRFGWPGDTLFRLEWVHSRDGAAVGYSVDVVPAAFVGGSLDEESIGDSLIQALSNGGFPPHHIDSTLMAVPAPARVAKELTKSGPVIRSQEVVYGTKGQVLAICLHYMDASSVAFRIRRHVI